ncbi:hypothetical protein [Amycolatopsis sp. WQ 127309]|uniref:hypothetical protein n=1 Tax=Amycolatopsis sp. WQ 127309 TaxID=2932773 RepID=UPI001FF6C8B4|nr:hypothetical protein [Amycolatopsis sp. WQ 127309]UOZ02528.1 hypothetical protein MUY22_27040 [Amycolatopsis sp. WQ 127309]
MTAPRNTVDTGGGPGFLHGGSGDQHITFYAAGFRRRRADRFVSDEHIAWLAARYVSPEAPHGPLFGEHRTIVVTGPDGAGRRTAALMALTDNATLDAGRLRELPDRAEDDERPLDPAEIRPGERLLLDLTRTDDQHVRDLRRDLEAFRHAVDHQDARFAVVVRGEQRALLPEWNAAMVKSIGRPPGRDVFEACLSAEAIPLPTTFQVPDNLEPYLAGSPVREVADLAFLTAEAARRGARDTLADWMREAVAAHVGRGHQAALLFREHQDPTLRALLVVAAFLPGASLDDMVAAESAFTTIVKPPREERHSLGGSYLAERMEKVKLHVDGRRDVAFTELALDKAVRAHFWTYFPDLRGQVSDWVAHVAPRLDMGSATGLVEYFAEHALATGPIEPLYALARRWSEGAGPKPLALQVLDAGLRDDTRAPEFRRFVYDWARKSHTPAGFATVMIEACTVTIAPARPIQAMVRLHYFTRSDDASVRDLARERLLELVYRRNFERWLIHRLATVVPHPPDRAILLGLRVPGWVAAGDRTRNHLLSLWRPLMAEGIGTLPEEPVRAWLAEHPLLLVEACDQQVRLLSRLYAFARDQVRTADEESREARLRSALALQHHIDTRMTAARRGEA